MGFLAFVEQPLTIDESQSIKRQLKRDGILQFLNLYKKFKDFENKDKVFKFGYEIELHLLKADTNTNGEKNYKLQLQTKDYKKPNEDFNIVDEYGAWMLEVIPSKPLDTYINGCGIYNQISNLNTKVKQLVGDNIPFYGPNYPKFGTNSFKHSYSEQYIEGVNNQFSDSKYLDDKIINPHCRFTGLTKNVRERRGENPQIIVPMFQDKKTQMNEVLPNEKLPGKIHLDAFSFGMGMNSIQETFATKNVDAARWMYDQFHVLTPMMLALSAATPVVKGKLSDWDTRWKLLEMGCDDRTEAERKNIAKSRYSTINYYISNDKRNTKKYNNLKHTINKSIKKFMKNEAKKMDIEIDNKLLDHFSYLWVRDPLVVFPSRINISNEEMTDHFENIQSTNWNNVRFKPPPSFNDKEIGWRVEFRSMEGQLTKERAFLFIHAIQIFARMIEDQTFGLNLYIPMDKANENFERAHQKDAATNQRFWFRKNIFSSENDSDEYLELTLLEIFDGNNEFIGLNNLLKMFNEHSDEKIKTDQKNRGCIINTNQTEYTFQFLTDIASGKIKTTAREIRDWIENNELYQNDSILEEEQQDQLIEHMIKMQEDTDLKKYIGHCIYTLNKN